MNVAVFSADALLSRMLLLEARRCGLQESAPEQAHVWLRDLDHPVSVPKTDAPLCIGFTAHPEALKNETRQGLYAVLPLPFAAQELDKILLYRETPVSVALVREGGQLWLAGKKLRFSKIEQAVLSVLFENRHRNVSVQELSLVIGESGEKSNAVAVYLYRLRRKLEADGITRIRTVRGVGYRWIGD